MSCFRSAPALTTLAAVWLVVDLALLGLALVLVVVFGVHAFSRFRRMNRFGRRAGGRLSELADKAGQLGERLDGLEERAESLAERSQSVRTQAERTQAERTQAERADAVRTQAVAARPAGGRRG